MNLTLVFLVLSAIATYLIYDTFKKSRQEQQLAQVQNPQPHSQQQTNKLKPTYAAQCTILKALHDEKMNALRHKSVSIHLLEQTPERAELSAEGREKIKEVIDTIKQTHKLHLLVCRRAEVTNPLVKFLRELGVPQIGYQSIEGAVAVLRQLNCNIHLESEVSLFKTLVQYLPNVWVADAGKSAENFNNQFRNEWDMLTSLTQISQLYKPKEE